MPAKPRFTLAHISDIHLPPLPSLRLEDLSLKTGLGALNWYRRRRHVHSRTALDKLVADMMAQEPDHVAVTGDLTNIGHRAEFEGAARWLHALGSPKQVTVVPGNHDSYDASAANAGLAHWAPYMYGETPAGGETRHGTTFPFVRFVGNGKIALIALSTATATPIFQATGRLGGAQLAALEQILDDLGRKSILRVVLLHHPPLPGQAGRMRALKDADRLDQLLRRSGAELVLHGHNHRRMAAFPHGPGGPIPIIGVPSASLGRSQHGDLARYHLFDFSPAGGPDWQIGWRARGLRENGGPICDIESSELPSVRAQIGSL